jgi:hypothetical protein
MKGLKIEKKTKTKVEQIRLVVAIICLLNDIILSDTQLLALCYMIVYGISRQTDELIIRSGIVKDKKVLSNVKTKLCKKGFLKRNDKEYRTYTLNLNKDFSIDDNDIRMLIKLNNQ